MFAGFSGDFVGIFPDKRSRAPFARHVVMAHNMIHRDIVFIGQFGHELCTVVEYLFGEIPIAVVHGFGLCTAFVFDQIDANGVAIARRTFVAFFIGTMPCRVSIFYCLIDGVISDEVM